MTPSFPGFLTSTPHIYVLDDDPSVLKSIRLLLESEGYVVKGYTSGHDCLDALKQCADLGAMPSCIVCDVIMPELNGWDFCKALREFSDIRVIFLTGAKHGIVETSTFNLSGVQLMYKPVDADVLMEAIKRGM